MISVVLLGAAGRMGRAIRETAARTPGFHLKACVDLASAVPAATRDWGTDLARVLSAGDVVLDFSAPGATVEAAKRCAERGAGLVSGTTGLTSAQEDAVREAARTVAVLRAANFSLGVLALRHALAAVLPLLPGWDVEVVERHHRDKQDSPSGTAISLAHDVAEQRGYGPDALRHGRQGRLGTRSQMEIGVHALRGGSWVGDHQIVLAGPGECVELRHVAQDRTAFASGALAAAGFVAHAPAGFYTLSALWSAATR